MDRRNFLKSTTCSLGMAASASIPLLNSSANAAVVSKQPTSETLVATLFRSLSEIQRKQICFPFDHPLRSKVVNNWFITKARVGEDFTADQQAMIREIFMGIHSEEYANQIFEQVAWDSDEEGLEDTSIALFGEPGAGKFEFVLTGRHVTRRCDGNSVEGAAFGGPIFYGHQAGDKDKEPVNHPGNAYWYQAKRANEVFQMLDGKQRDLALLGQSRPEQATKTVQLTGKTTELPGIPMTELLSDQKDLVRKVLGDVLAPFRKQDADEALQLIEQAGIDHLHMAFFKNQDLGNDGVWDVWQIEGPSSLIFFRGEPHVHAYIHIRDSAEV
ncbi:MAG: DUF3500 domain-containing protein [Verrucomicrobia bacterium]|nr:DUF3500 domain-containing protein [Verrucomicrobiota bacterium]